LLRQQTDWLREKEASLPLLAMSDEERLLADYAEWTATSGQLRLLRAEANALRFLHDLLEVLFGHLRVENLISTGLTSNSRIAVTAHDANMRAFDIYIPNDCSSAQRRGA
jgi:nicotinamidase-related amidase